MKSFKHLLVFSILFFMSANILAQTTVMIGPRVTGNYNIYNQKGSTLSWNGIGVGVGAVVDASFSKHIGLMVHLNAFDMRNFSTSLTTNNVVEEESQSLSYITLEPMFKTEFSGFFMVAGPSVGIKLNSSGEYTRSQTGATPQVSADNWDTKSIRFDIAVGTGYTFKLSNEIGLGTDFMAQIPLTSTYNFIGVSNSIFTLKLGVSLKFKI
ncbi:MAG: outer membrane beta-barrel protein [Ignavibacteriales bacterium]|nr:outer membrane beta-barrel protein [Ignavibacteriales bacterium]